MLSSSDIRVYPSSKRVGIDPGAKFTTEYNLTNLINRLTNRQAFVITDAVLLDSSNGITNFEFNILGYYFLVNLPKTLLSEANSVNKYLNASITITQNHYGDNATFYNWWQLEGQDETINTSKQFRGLQLDWSNQTTHQPQGGTSPNLSGVWRSELSPSTSVIYTFTILERTASGYIIPPASKIRLFTSTDGNYRSVSIDDGELTSNDTPALPEQPSQPETVEVNSIQLEPEDATIEVDSTLQLYATISPSNATNQNVNWSSSNNSVATVSDNGLVTAESPGTATITAAAEANNDIYATCEVTVNPTDILPISIELDQLSIELEEGQESQLTATVEPDDATDQTINWNSLDSSVATVSNNGLVKAIGEGTTTIVATTINDISDTCQVTVNTQTDEPGGDESLAETIINGITYTLVQED